MKGKEKCKILKEVRAQIAAANDIEWVTENCSHKGDCRGTCPKCEAEVAALERALERRRALGKTVAVAGLSAGLIVSTSACALRDVQSTAGDMAAESDRVKHTSKFVATGDIDTSVTDAIDGELPATPGEIVEIMGDLNPNRYYTDFNLFDARLFEADEDLYAYGVIIDEDGDYPSDIYIPVGARFEVVGEMEDWYIRLVRYEDVYYAVYDSMLGAYAHEVTDAQTELTDMPVTDTPVTE